MTVLSRSSNFIHQQNLKQGKPAFCKVVKSENELSLGHLVGLTAQSYIKWLQQVQPNSDNWYSLMNREGISAQFSRLVVSNTATPSTAAQ